MLEGLSVTRDNKVLVQATVRKMRHVLQIPISGFDGKQHTHECEYCEDKEVPCSDTFYVKAKNLEDTILCRKCAEIPEMQKLFRALPRLLRMGSNITDKHGPMGPAEE